MSVSETREQIAGGSSISFISEVNENGEVAGLSRIKMLILPTESR